MTASEQTFVKQRRGAPTGFFVSEAAGLAWLAETTGTGGVDVVGVQGHDDGSLTLDRLSPATPSDGMARAANRFGAAWRPRMPQGPTRSVLCRPAPVDTSSGLSISPSRFPP